MRRGRSAAAAHGAAGPGVNSGAAAHEHAGRQQAPPRPRNQAEGRRAKAEVRAWQPPLVRSRCLQTLLTGFTEACVFLHGICNALKWGVQSLQAKSVILCSSTSSMGLAQTALP